MSWPPGSACENRWTFGSNLRKQADQLAARDLVLTTYGITENTIRVGLTEAGKAAVLSTTYQPRPAVKHVTERQLVDALLHPTAGSSTH